MIPINVRSGASIPPSVALSAGQAERAVRSPAAVNAGTAIASAQHAASYPDRPRISSEPLRYNVQLNQQLTAVQQADGFLLDAEKQLLQLNHLIVRRAAGSEVAKQADSLLQLLSTREKRSAGTLDRQLQLSLQSKPTVRFSLQDGAALLQDTRPEMLTFSLAGRQRSVSAADLDGSSPQQHLLRLNQALGRWGIRAELSDRQLRFQVEEQRWQDVSQHLSVQGGGERYPQGQFYPLKPLAESGLEESLQQLSRTPSAAGTLQGHIEQALETVTRQRNSLRTTRSRVQQRIDSMATFNGPAAAYQAAEDLARRLHQRDFQYVSQALAGQANVQRARVRNVLSTS